MVTQNEGCSTNTLSRVLMPRGEAWWDGPIVLSLTRKGKIWSRGRLLDLVSVPPSRANRVGMSSVSEKIYWKNVDCRGLMSKKGIADLKRR